MGEPEGCPVRLDDGLVVGAVEDIPLVTGVLGFNWKKTEEKCQAIRSCNDCHSAQRAQLTAGHKLLGSVNSTQLHTVKLPDFGSCLKKVSSAGKPPKQVLAKRKLL